MASANIRVENLSMLPKVCVCCGSPATEFRKQEFRLNGAMSMAVLTASALAGCLAWTERSVTLHLPVCHYHRRTGRKSNQTFFRGFIISVFFGLAAYVASHFEGQAASFLAIAGMSAFMVTMVAAMNEVDDGIKIQSWKENTLSLTGVSKPFAEAVNAVVYHPQPTNFNIR